MCINLLKVIPMQVIDWYDLHRVKIFQIVADRAVVKVGRTILPDVLSSFLGSIRIFVFPAVHSSSIRGTKVQHTRLFEDMTKYRPSSSTNLQAANNNTARDRLMTSFARGQGSAREMDQPRVGKVGCFWVACSVIMEPVAAFPHTDHDLFRN